MNKKIMFAACVFSAVLLTAPASNAETSSATAAETSPAAAAETLPSGLQVITDYSRLTPYEPPEEIYTRRSADPVNSLAPADDYGSLYPYTGDVLYSLSAAGYSEELATRMGFTDEKGELVTDPCYRYIQPVRDIWTGTVFPYYYMTGEYRAMPSASQDSQNENDGNNGYSPMTVASADGKWVSADDYLEITCGDGYFFAAKPDTSFDLIDSDGTVILRSEDMDQSLVSNRNLYGSGRISGETLCLNLKDGFSFFSLDGGKLCGPYADAGIFSEGMAPAAVKQGQHLLYGYISDTGDWLIRPQFTAAEPFKNGRAAAKLDNIPVIIGTDGEVLLRADKNTGTGARFTQEDYGFHLTWFDNSAKTYQNLYYDRDLKPLLSDSSYKGFSMIGKSEDGYLAYRILHFSESGNVAEITDGKKMLSFSDAVNVYPFSSRRKDKGRPETYLLVNLGPDSTRKTEATHWKLLDHSLDTIIEGNGKYHQSFLDSVTGRFYFAFSSKDDEGTVTVYDPERKKLFRIARNIRISEVMNGMFRVRDSFSSGYLDSTGKWIFRISLMNALAD